MEQHKCSVCHKLFQTQSAVRRHMLVHTGDKTFVCQICDKSFQQKSNLQIHVERVHAKIFPFTCTECGRQFGYSSHFKKHLQKHLVNKAQLSEEVKKMILKPHECLECFRCFATKCKLKRHMMDHLEPRVYVCEKCGRELKSKESLLQHIKNMHETVVRDKDGFVCEQCGIVYRNKYGIFLHIKKGHPVGSRGSLKIKDTQNLEVECTVCNKNVKKSYIKIHMNIHTKNRLYSCTFCGKSFTDARNKKNHERIHTGERPFVCEVCKKSFTQRSNLLTHHKKKHKLVPLPNATKTEKNKHSNLSKPEENKKKKEVVKKEKLKKINADLTVEINKIKDMVSEEQVEPECLDSVEKILHVTNSWVDQQYQVGKQKIDKSNIKPLTKDKSNINVDSGLLEPMVTKEDVNVDDVPLSHFLTSNLPTDAIEVEIGGEEYLSDVDVAESNYASDIEAVESNSGNIDIAVSNITTENPMELHIENVKKELFVIRKKISAMILDKLIKELRCMLNPAALEQILSQIKVAKTRRISPLTFILRKDNIPDNNIFRNVKSEQKILKRVWACWDCKATFEKIDLFKRHLITHLPDNENPIRCNYCEKTFKQVENLREHIMFHNDEKRYYCEHCGAGFRHSSNFKCHLIKHFGEVPEEYKSKKPTKPKRTIKCYDCSEVFSSRSEQLEHLRTHTFPCKDCGQEFNDKRKLRCHIQRTHVKKHVCPICESKFGASYFLKRHMSVHTGEKCICECGKSFTETTRLKRHKKICSLNPSPLPKSHVCELCSKAFYEKYDLMKHIKTHDDKASRDKIKPFQCHICLLKVTRNHTLKRHIARKHGYPEEPKTLLQCNFCDKIFITEERLKKHIDKHTKEIGGGLDLSKASPEYLESD